MCIKDAVTEARTKLAETKNLVVERSYDIRMSLANKDNKDEPIKSVCLHKSCSTPLLKVFLVALWIVLSVMFVSMVIKYMTTK